MRGEDLPPEEFRCKRTDGRQWRCKRRAMDGKTLCDVHHLQGIHRQHKQKVPESLKLERKVKKKKTAKREIERGESSRGGSGIEKSAAKRGQKRVSESLDEALKRMKLKKGDLHLELIRVFLQRQVEKKKEREMKESAIEDETRELPYGVMAISQSSPFTLQDNGESGVLDVKLGADSNGDSLLQRSFRSKSIEPLPISTMQVVPFAENVKKMKIKKCHWCRKSKFPGLIKCLTCRKQFFCVECITERYFEKQEVKVKCPVCCGTCSCKLCIKQKIRDNDPEDSYSGVRKPDRKQSLQYLIYMLLPVLKKVNNDQNTELETESKVTGIEQSEIQIPKSKLDIHTLHRCNKCKTSIVDYHRTCMNCSYNLCLHCCREVLGHSIYGTNGSSRLRSCKKRKIHSSGDDLLSTKNISRPTSGGLPLTSIISLQNWKTNEDGKIPCPPTDIGGCGGGLLDIRCTLPFNWTRDLEVKAEELLCSHQFPETSDASTCCLLCSDVFADNGEIRPHRELYRRLCFSGNYLYCPFSKDLHQESLDHFRSHWVKGHPVIVRNVLPSNTELCWDPVNIFCSYMENKSTESRDGDGLKTGNCLDWCEVEIVRKKIFMGTLEKRTHASVRQKVLKFQAWLSTHLFQKQFPTHYNEILSALPLPEYINPISGLLNVGVKLPKELPKPDLGPSIYISYGGPEDLMQADFLSKLCYRSHDTVNILAYTTDAPTSPEQINKIESLMKKYKARDNNQGQQSFSNSSDQKAKSPLQSGDTGESGLHDNRENNFPNGTKSVPITPIDHALKGQPLGVENGDLSDDDESDAEVSILCSGSIENSEDSDKQFHGEEVESSCSSRDKCGTSSCGAQWDIFSRQDVPKLVEYLKRHSNELTSACSYSKHQDHPILDQTFFLDAYHKLRLKEEFDIQPWSFEQHTGEAIFIPAGCPYQTKKIKSCVNVVVDFLSPENATRCVQLNDEIRLLPARHRAKGRVLEVERMALQGISAAVEDIHKLMHVNQ